MEAFAGVFVTKTATDEWETDPQIPGSQKHELVRADGVHAGFSRFSQVDGPVTWTPERREVALVIEGSVRIEIDERGTLDLGPGDLFSLPPGVPTTWHISVPFKEMWVLASD